MPETQTASTRVPKHLVEAYRRKYGMSDSETIKDIAAIAMVAGLDERLRREFIKELNLNEDLVDRVVRDQTTVSIQDFKHSIDSIQETVNAVHHDTRGVRQMGGMMNEMLILDRLMAYGLYNKPVNYEYVSGLLTGTRATELADSVNTFIKNSRKKK